MSAGIRGQEAAWAAREALYRAASLQHILQAVDIGRYPAEQALVHQLARGAGSAAVWAARAVEWAEAGQ